MSIPDPCRTDHLYLLIGGNPLPNYVAARLLLKEGGMLRLVHSAKVRPIADTLLKLMAKHFGLTNTVLLEVPEADGDAIARKVEQDLQSIEKLGGRPTVGLHYTGGTKAMAVHAYFTVRSWVAAQKRPAVFSYLDARTMALQVECHFVDGVRGGPQPPIDLSHWPQAQPPDIKQLAELHNEQLTELPSSTPYLPAVAAQMANFCREAEVAKQWRKWCGIYLKRNKFSWTTGPGGIEHALVHWPDLGLAEYNQLGPLCAMLAAALGQPRQGVLNVDQAAAALPDARRSVLLAWLDGKWLEEYVLEAIRQVAGSADLQPVFGRGMKTDATDGHSFELDVVAMRGYRLFAISCSTSTDKAAGKSKLFEAMIRATQLGGSEARIALVSLYEPSAQHEHRDQLYKEVIEQWGADDQIRVFGPAHLPHLPALFANWFVTGK